MKKEVVEDFPTFGKIFDEADQFWLVDQKVTVKLSKKFKIAC